MSKSAFAERHSLRPLPCRECEDGQVFYPLRGGNDPDGHWFVCLTCDGSGNRECDKSGCFELATIETDDNEGYCADCHARWLEAAGE